MGRNARPRVTALSARALPGQGELPMPQLVLQFQKEATDGECALCSQPLCGTVGTHLSLAENSAPVCQSCGRRHAPALAALANLAGVAERVGRIANHQVVPPMSALLDLARAAENYSYQTGEGRGANGS